MVRWTLELAGAAFLLLDRVLSRIIETGELTVADFDGTSRRYGVLQEGRRPVAIRFTDARAAGDIAKNPRLGIAEAYMDGRMVLDEGDIHAFLDLFTSNARWEGTGKRQLFKRKTPRWIAKLGRRNKPRQARANVAHHYDLSDELYRLFLDEDMQYSCAYFTDPANSLDQAQRDKKAHIAAKLHLAPGNQVLDIGCGWGGMALFLAKTAPGVHVTGVTLSAEQIKVARSRAEAEGLADRVHFELVDYRAVTGRFDRIVSVGMFEHVGQANYDAFFAKCRELLTADGVMLLHTIGKLGKPGTTDPFIAKYIFPGGYNPALSEILAASEKSKLIAADIETLRIHYALTLRHWLARVIANRGKIVDLYDGRFFRMWEFYLAGAITAFENGSGCNYQVQYIRERRTLPITRNYMAEAEALLSRSP